MNESANQVAAHNKLHYNDIRIKREHALVFAIEW